MHLIQQHLNGPKLDPKPKKTLGSLASTLRLTLGHSLVKVVATEIHKQLLRETITFKIVSDITLGDKSWRCRKLAPRAKPDR